jgi:hypothetical protein
MGAEKGTTVVQSLPVEATEEAELSFQFTKQEHALTWWDAMRLHYPAIGWGLFMNMVSPKFPKSGLILILSGDHLERH